jgi:hypothetical protein
MARRVACWLLALSITAGGGCGESSDTADATLADGPAADLAGDAVLDAGGPEVGSADGLAPDIAPADGGNPCPRLPGPDDYTRKVVVARPYNASGQKASVFSVLTLPVSGKLADTGQTFSLGSRASSGEIVFTPDGEVGLVALENGTVGVFTFDAAGQVQVIHPALQTAGYTTRVVMGLDGQRAYLLSAQWRNNGGGVYSVKINCDGSLTDEGLVAASKLPYTMALLEGQPRALVVADDILSSQAGHDVHLLGLGASWSVLAGVDGFGDDEAIVSNAALTADQRFLLVADISVFSSTAGNRVAVVEILANNQLKAVQVLKPLTDPASVVASPYNNAALVLNGEGNAITVLDYMPQVSPPFKVRGPLAASSKPLLPIDAVMVGRGALKGRVLVTENTAIRQVQFEASGQVSESELFSLGSGYTAIPGAIGIQP